MQRVRKREPDITWERYLLKLSEGKREATEEPYQKTSLTYGDTMTSAVRIAIDRLISEDDVMMHAMRFLSFFPPEPIPLDYVVQYVLNCMPDEDEALLADRISSCSLIITTAGDESRKIRIHQVVHSCLQINNENIKKEDETWYLTKFGWSHVHSPFI